jgi:hypothetical protein
MIEHRKSIYTIIFPFYNLDFLENGILEDD